MKRAPYRALTLAIHPNTRGFGWIALSSPFSPYDWGNVGTRGKDKNAHCLRRIEKLLDRLMPETLVLEAFEQPNSRRRGRIEGLGRATVALAVSRNIDVAIYTFRDVQMQFAHVGARTRDDIAEAIAHTLDQIRHCLPPRRRVWQSEPWRLSLFCAAALAMTHYQREATGLLKELS